jgi:[protein-PII] uridylyltransferase
MVNLGLKNKKIILETKNKLIIDLKNNKNGYLFSKNYTKFIDKQIKEIVSALDTSEEEFTLIAVGGYGREDVAPFSDIDLLLIYKRQNKFIKNLISQLNNTLWDSGLDISISYLTIKQVINDSKQDIKTLTKFLESRYLYGSTDLFGEHTRSIKILIGRLNPLKLSKKKLEELFLRHDNALGTKSTLEPNIKEGVGCLRDIHTLIWISGFLFDVRKIEELLPLNILAKLEIDELKTCWRFLITVRSLNHYLNQSKSDVVSIENQLKIAKILKYKDKAYKIRKKELGVEKFMKDLFSYITKISQLLNVFYSKLPEELISSTIFQQGAKVKNYKSKDFKITKSFLDFKNYSFNSLSSNWLNLLNESLNNDILVHPRVIGQLREHYKKIVPKLKTKDFDIIRSIIISQKNPVRILRHLNDSRILNAIFPEFGRVWGQVQYDIYHQYTTDEHLIVTLHHLHELIKMPFNKELYEQLTDKPAIHIALLFHDIGKRGPKSHSIYGKELTAKILKRLPVSESERNIILWVIENHLLMSDTAFKSDTTDPGVVANFIQTVNTSEKLNILYLFTICDIAAVGPERLTEWKIALLKQLLFRSKDFLFQGLDIKQSSQKIAKNNIVRFENFCSDKPELLNFLKLQNKNIPLAFWQNMGFNLIRELLTEYENFSNGEWGHYISFDKNTNNEYSQVVIITKTRPGILKDIVKGISNSQLNILGAQINSLFNGDVIDVFWVSNFKNQSISRKEEKDFIRQKIGKSIESSDIILKENLFKKISPIEIESSVSVDNELSSKTTTVQVVTSDKPGRLYKILEAFYEIQQNVLSAKISTLGEKIFDIFQITDSKGKKITNSEDIKNIKKKIMSVL